MEPISTESVQRWKSRMSSLDLKIADHIAGSLLAELGYERYSPGQFTASEWFHFCYLALKYNLSAALRWALYAGGFFTLNRNMRNAKSLAD